MGRLIKGLTKQTSHSGVAHHMLMQKHILKHLHEQTEIEHCVPFWMAFLCCVDEKQFNFSGASEYEIYFNFALKYYPQQHEIISRNWVNNLTLTQVLAMDMPDPQVDYYACHFHLE